MLQISGEFIYMQFQYFNKSFDLLKLCFVFIVAQVYVFHFFFLRKTCFEEVLYFLDVFVINAMFMFFFYGTHTCVCSTENYWNPQTQVCSICPNGVCPTLNSVSENNHINCGNGYYYNSASLSCLVCTSDTKSNGASTSQNSCGCVSGYYWNIVTQTCTVCSTLGYPKTLNAGSCVSGSYFNSINSNCQVCSTVSNSNGLSVNQNACGCNTGFYWIKSTQTCNACPTSGCPVAPVNGKCASGSYLNQGANGCLSCSTDTQSTGVSSTNNGCVCNANYFWDYVNQVCSACALSGCPTMPISGRCTAGSFMSVIIQGCLLCSTVAQTTGVSSGNNACVCNSNYYWSQQSQSCVICPTTGCPLVNLIHNQNQRGN